MTMRVVCINDSGKPDEIRQSNWVVKGNEYTVVLSAVDMLGESYYKLLEIKPDLPYSGYASYRFAPLSTSINDIAVSSVKEFDKQLERV